MSVIYACCKLAGNYFDIVDSFDLTLTAIQKALIIYEHISLSHDANRSHV